jgi:3D (Asp-Asp-Asp) domain-containing protein
MLSPKLIVGEEIYKTCYEETAYLPDKNFKPAIQWQEITVEATAYCSCKYCTGWGKNITASGTTPSRGTIAAPRHIPFGTIIKLDGLGEFVVQDRGGGIKVKNGIILIDVWMESHQEALKFGRKKLQGWIKVEQ